MLRGNLWVLLLVAVTLAAGAKEETKAKRQIIGTIRHGNNQNVASENNLWNSILAQLGLIGQPATRSPTILTTATTPTAMVASSPAASSLAASSVAEGISSTSKTASQSVSHPSTDSDSVTLEVADGVTTAFLSPLQKAHWCPLPNGTYVPLDYSFVSTTCTINQCLLSRTFRKTLLERMVVYCIDGSSAIRYVGQCCGQCPSELPGKRCQYQGLEYPHGAIIKSEKNKLQCWCQQGQIECRNYLGSVFDGLNLWGDGTAVYVIISVIILVLLVGSLLCCGCTIFFYYYYKRHQNTLQQAYDQYWNSAGWQPMNSEETLEDGGLNHDGTGDDKQAEVDQGHLESDQYLAEHDGEEQQPPQQFRPPVFMPPPYALYNGAYVSEEQHNSQKML